ncbi:MAG: hypothetical protein Q9221_000552 [Calogaya cf. arnoldii]
MYSQLLHSAIYLPVFLTSIIAATTPAPPSLNIPTEEAPLRTLTATTPNGQSFEILQDIKQSNVSIGNAWQRASWDRPYDQSPTLRPVDLAGVKLLLDLTIAKYATRPSDELAEYGTIGPETFPTLKHLDTRVTVKQWEPGKNKKRFWIPAAPSRNKEIAYAAQMAKNHYNYASSVNESVEYAWVTAILSDPDETGRRSLVTFNGVLMVQRDLWYPV